jgi:hypothetical protein
MTAATKMPVGLWIRRRGSGWRAPADLDRQNSEAVMEQPNVRHEEYA